MATLIPSFGSCVARMTAGERRLAERLEKKLDDDYLAWYDVPVGPTRAHPDFIVLHPRRGLLILEVKDWRLDTIRLANRSTWEIVPGGQPKHVSNPIEQARHYAHRVVDALACDRQLLADAGRTKGKLAFPWSYGVVLTHIARRQFESAGLGDAIDAHRVVCADEMTETCDAESFQSRLWSMFPTLMRGVLSLPQIDRIRWILFPEVRVGTQRSLFAASDAASDDRFADGGGGKRSRGTAVGNPDTGTDDRDEVPDVLQVMDLQQEQLARSLGDGHRVIHGVAGSGKTMILGVRAEQLAKAANTAHSILVLCYNEPLALTLGAVMAAKGIDDRVLVRHFHKWCRQQLVAFGQPLPAPSNDFFDQLVKGVIRGVERRQIPSGQYQAVLIDEGHDFSPEWLQLAAQMVDPRTNRLLVLYDDAQAIYERSRKRQFSFKRIGIQAQGRTTVLRVNYRNTRQVLQTANLIADDLLNADERSGDGDGIPTLRPLSCGRDGPAPLVLRLPSLRHEAQRIAELLAAAHAEGAAWGDMAVICRRHTVMDECAAALRRRGLPHRVRRSSGQFAPHEDAIKVLTMHACKGLEFAVVALPGVGRMPEPGEAEAGEARLFYVAATRATQRLYITLSGDGAFAQRFAA